MRRSRRLSALAPVLALLVSLGVAGYASGQQATPVSQVAQGEDTRIFPVSIHRGTCDWLGQAAYQLAPIGLPQGGQVVNAPAVPAYESVTTIPGATLDDFLNGSFAIPVSKSDVEVDTVVACGLIGGTRYGDNLLFSLGAEGGTAFAAVVKMTQDQQGVTVTIHLIVNPTGGATPAAGASPVAGASPAASPVASPVVGGQQEGQAQGNQGAGQQPQVIMVDVAFQPANFTVPAGQDVQVTLTNNGASAHNFTIDELNVHSGDVQPGQTGQVRINAQPGTYPYYCSVPGHKEAGMVGQLTVL